MVIDVPPGWVAIVTGAMTLAGMLLTLINTYLVTRVKKIAETANQTAESTKKAMVQLEVHTNSIKDALVKVTGESEFRKGFALGSGSADPSMAAFAQLHQREVEARERLAGEGVDRRATEAEQGGTV